MNRWLRDASIRTKLLVVVMLVTTTALLLASVSLLFWDYYQFRNDIQQELSTEGEMVLENSTAAMSFQDRKAATETIETLARNPHIRVGCLYSASGALFAEFRREDALDPCPASAPAPGARATASDVKVVVGTRVAGEPAGRVYIQSDLGAVTLRARVQALTAAVVLLVALGVALLLSAPLQRVISEPLTALARIAREVSTRHDYSLRATRTTNDELGVLVDAFNGMLERIGEAERERTELLASERQANRLKDEFLMTLSHELRTPLNAIVGWTQILRSKLVGPEQTEDALERIERNGRAQARLIEDLLDVSRLTTGKLSIEPTDVDLIDLVRLAIETVGSLAETRNVSISSELGAPSVRVSGDANRLQQVIWNLMSNAIKFSPAGSRVTVRVQVSGNRCEVRVQDQGIGIDPAFLPFVFEPFRQGDASITRTYGGLGLGLSIVKRIVELHGGTVAAQSEGLGKGSTFLVNLPCAVNVRARDMEHSVPSVNFSSDDLAGLNLLIVDDDADARAMMLALVRSAGGNAREAANGRDAVARVSEVMPDVLVSDIAMPDLDGYALLRELHKRFGRDMPRVAVAVTAHATATDRDLALAAGFDWHLSKPFDPGAFVQLVRTAAGRKGVRQARFSV